MITNNVVDDRYTCALVLAVMKDNNRKIKGAHHSAGTQIQTTHKGKHQSVSQAVCVVQCSSTEEPEPAKRPFGPFVEVPADQVKLAGFSCRHCGQRVEVLRQALPTVVARICIYSCGCKKSIVVWEDERQPAGPKHWYRTMKFLRKTKVDVMICNGNRPLSPDFGGLN